MKVVEFVAKAATSILLLFVALAGTAQTIRAYVALPPNETVTDGDVVLMFVTVLALFF